MMKGRRTTIPTIIEKKIYWIIKIYYILVEFNDILRKWYSSRKRSVPGNRKKWRWWILEPHIAQLPITCTHKKHFYSWSFSFMITIQYSLFIHIYNIENSIHSLIHSFVGSWEKKSRLRLPFIQIMMVKSTSNKITFWIPSSFVGYFIFFHLIACIWMKIIAWHKTFEVKQPTEDEKKQKGRGKCS